MKEFQRQAKTEFMKYTHGPRKESVADGSPRDTLSL